MSLSKSPVASGLPYLPGMDEQERVRLQVLAAEARGVACEFQDSLSSGEPAPTMAVLPAGVFEMGSPGDEFGHRAEEGPIHYQQVSEAFAIGVCPVTADDFARFERDTGWRWRSDLITSEGSHPVINLRHAEVETYCRWLSEQTGQHYRLPSEAEWEYACRAGTLTPFAFGESVTCRDVHFKAAFPYEEARQNKRWYLPKCAPIARTVPVGSYPPNLWGLHDMHGNVWEMTRDNWSPSHMNLPRKHPAPLQRRRKWITVRGGSWFDAAVFSRSASRRPRLRDELDVNLGFRVVREL